MKQKSLLLTRLAYVFILLALSALYCFLNIPCIEISEFDEALYLLNAVTNTVQPRWSPLYSFFYKISLWLSPSLLIAYDLNLFIVCGLLWPCAIYVFIATIGGTEAYCLMAALLGVLARFNLYNHTPVHVFNQSVLLLLFSLLYIGRRYLLRCFFYFLLGVAVFIRVENVIIAGAFFFFSASSLIHKKMFLELKRSLVFPFFFILGITVTSQYFGFGGFDSRVSQAFKDHYINRNPEVAASIEAFDQRFSRAHSLVSFMREYPREFFSHVKRNSRSLLFDFFHSIHYLQVSHFERGNYSGGWPVFMLLLFYAFSAFGPLISDGPRISDTMCFVFSMASQSLALSLLLQPWYSYLVGASFVFFLVLIPSTLHRYLYRHNPAINRFVTWIPWVITLLAFFLMVTRHLNSAPAAAARLLSRPLAVELDRRRIFLPDDIVLAADLIFLYGVKHPEIFEHSRTMFHYLHVRENFQGFKDYLDREKVTLFCFSEKRLSFIDTISPQAKTDILSTIDVLATDDSVRRIKVFAGFDCIRFSR